MSKLSFIIPCYNKEAYISESIKSVLDQKFSDIDLVVIDDKSTDDSRSIIDWYASKDKRIKTFYLDKNYGRSNARNVGVNFTKSQIICVQDADDISLENRADKVYNTFKKKNPDVVYSSFYTGTLNGATEVEANPFDYDKVKEPPYWTYICHSTMAYKKRCAEAVPYSEGVWSKLGVDDWKLQMDLFARGYNFLNIKTPLVLYRTSSNSISNNRDEDKVRKAKEKYLNEEA